VAVSAVDLPGSGHETVIPRRGARTYALVWCTQLLAMFVTAVTALSLSIGTPVYNPFYTGSVLLLAVAYALTFIPFAAASPLGGPLVDRWGPKRTLVFSGTGTLVLMSALAAVLAAGVLTIWMVWVVLLGVAAFKAVQITALESTVPLLVPKQHIVRANGSRFFLTAVTAAFALAVAGVLVPVVSMQAITWVTCLVVIIAVTCAARAGIPSARPREAAGAPLPLRGGNKPLWAYVHGRRGLIALFGFFAVFNFVTGFAEIADREISAGFGSSATLNIVLGTGAVGMLATTVAITIWGGPRRPIRGMLGYSLVFGAALVLGSSRPNLLVVSAAAVLFLGSAPFLMAIIGTLLHTKTEPGLMGRMMGLKNLVIGISYPAGNIVAVLCGAFAKSLAGGNRAGTGFSATLVGTGQATGRGYAIMTMAVGVLTIITVLLAGRHRSLRDLDTNLADVTPDDLMAGQHPVITQADTETAGQRLGASGAGVPVAAADVGRK